MADVQFAPPLQRLSSPPDGSPMPPPPLAGAAMPALRLAPVSAVRFSETTGSTALSFQDLLPAKTEARPVRRKKRGGRKLFSLVVLLGLGAGAAYYFRDSGPVRRVLGRDEKAAPLPDVPFTRPTITSAEYSITLSAVQNGVPNNVTTKVRADYISATSQTTIERQVGGAFTTAQEIHTVDAVYQPTADGASWTRQARTPETPTTYDTADSILMVDDVVDHALRDAVQPKSSKPGHLGTVEVTTLTYLLDRARVPEIAPAIFARVPWLFDVPNAATLTVEVSYDKSGIVRHLAFGVDPPQPGTGSDATWVTSYTMDITSLDSPVTVDVPFAAGDAPAGTP